jgi:hypothetical protein
MAAHPHAAAGRGAVVPLAAAAGIGALLGGAGTGNASNGNAAVAGAGAAGT